MSIFALAGGIIVGLLVFWLVYNLLITFWYRGS